MHKPQTQIPKWDASSLNEYDENEEEIHGTCLKLKMIDESEDNDLDGWSWNNIPVLKVLSIEEIFHTIQFQLSRLSFFFWMMSLQ
jgi:hypothetical protein